MNTQRCTKCIPPLLTLSLSKICTHTHYAATAHRRLGRDRQVPAHENLCFRMIRGEADGTISEAAAARPTAPSGAENQDNFIVIISLPLSPSLQLLEEERGVQQRGRGREKEKGGRGRSKNTKEKMYASCLVSCTLLWLRPSFFYVYFMPSVFIKVYWWNLFPTHTVCL